MQSPGMGPGNPGQPFDPPYNAPIPSPMGGSGYGTSGPPQIRYDVIGEAWKLVQPTLGVWVPAMLIYLVVTIGLSFLINAVTGGGVQVPVGGQGAPSINPVMFIINQLLNNLVSAFFMGGIYRMAFNQVRGRAVSIGDLFSGVDVFVPLLIAAILMNIAMAIGFVLCVIPGLLLAACFMFTMPLIVDKSMGAVEAISLSFNTLKSQAFSALGFTLVIGLVIIAGMLACGIGIFVTLPIALVAIVLLYRDFFPDTEAPQPATFGYTPPPPPIPPV